MLPLTPAPEPVRRVRLSRSDALDALTNNGGTLHNLACAKAIFVPVPLRHSILIVIILLNGLKVF